MTVEFELVVRVRVSSSSCHTRTPYSNTILELQTRTPNSNSKLEPQTRTPNSNSKLEPQSRTPNSNSKLEHHTRTPYSNPKLEHHTRTLQTRTRNDFIKSTVSFSSAVSILCVTVDNRFTLSDHIASLCRSCTFQLRQIRTI